MGAEPGTKDSVTIGFPVKCVYKGGHSTLGKHGKHFRIEKMGRLATASSVSPTASH